MFTYLGRIIGTTGFGSGGNMQLSEFKKLGGWLYEASYNTLDYEYAKSYFDNKYMPAQPAGCSVVRNGNFFGRNFDWTYDESITLVARTAPDENRYASVGIVGSVPGLTRSVAESGSFDESLMIAPFCLVDGINSEGLTCNINMLTREESKGLTTGTTPAVEEQDRVCMLMLVRYILDHYASVDEAVDGIRDYVKVYAPDSAAYSSEFHFMLADAEKTVILEFVNNEMVVIDAGPEEDFPSIMMNFYADGVTLNSDGTITRNTSTDPEAVNVNGVTPFGQGIERFNIAVAGYSGANSAAGMKDLMRSLFYTQAYTLVADNWYTEFLGEWDEELGGTLRVTTPVANFALILAAAAEKYNNRSREKSSENYGTWQTVHTVVYDMAAKKLDVCVQEGSEYVSFSLYESAGTGGASSYSELPDKPSINSVTLSGNKSLDDLGIASKEELTQLESNVGDLGDLETESKDNLVEAINEVNAKPGVSIFDENVTFTEVLAAYNDGKAIFIISQNNIFRLEHIFPTAQKAFFVSYGFDSAESYYYNFKVLIIDSGGFGGVLTRGLASQINPNAQHSEYRIPSVRAVYGAIHPAVATSIPSSGIKPNILYNVGTLTGEVTINLATPTDSTIMNIYHICFETGATAPTITWGSAITSWMGGSAPTINANKHYEVSVLNGVAIAMEV